MAQMGCDLPPNECCPKVWRVEEPMFTGNHSFSNMSCRFARSGFAENCFFRRNESGGCSVNGWLGEGWSANTTNTTRRVGSQRQDTAGIATSWDTPFLNQTLTKKNKNNKWRRDHVENHPLRHSWDNSLGHCCTQQNYCTVYTSLLLGKGVNSSQTLGDLPNPQRCCNGFGLQNGPQTRPQTGPDFYDIYRCSPYETQVYFGRI